MNALFVPPKPPPLFPLEAVNLVRSAPAPRSTQLLLVALNAATEKVPAGICTMPLVGHEANALWIDAAVTVPLASVLQAAVVQIVV